MAPHRFNNTSKPMVRGTLNIRPMSGEAQAIWQIRGPKSFEGEAMVNWAKWVDTSHLMLFAFMTEGGLEVCKVTRGIEPEDADMSQWADSTECFFENWNRAL